MTQLDTDPIAMSENGDWTAFPRTVPRRRILSLAADLHETDWWTLVHDYRVRAGYIRETPDGERGWYFPCEPGDDGAFPVWIVERR